MVGSGKRQQIGSVPYLLSSQSHTAMKANSRGTATAPRTLHWPRSQTGLLAAHAQLSLQVDPHSFWHTPPRQMWVSEGQAQLPSHGAFVSHAACMRSERVAGC